MRVRCSARFTYWRSRFGLAFGFIQFMVRTSSGPFPLTSTVSLFCVDVLSLKNPYKFLCVFSETFPRSRKVGNQFRMFRKRFPKGNTSKGNNHRGVRTTNVSDSVPVQGGLVNVFQRFAHRTQSIITVFAPRTFRTQFLSMAGKRFRCVVTPLLLINVCNRTGFFRAS